MKYGGLEMFEYVENIMREMREFYDNNKDFVICMLKSDVGMGKSTITNRFLTEIKQPNALFIRHIPCEIMLNSLLHKLSAKMPFIEPYNTTQSSFTSFVTGHLLKYLKKFKCNIIVFDDIEKYDKEMFFFIVDFIRFMKNSSLLKPFFLC